MSASPRGHVYLKDAFLYYAKQRVFLAGGRSVALSRADRAVIECLHRGESELGVLAHSLAALEIGGDMSEIERTVVETLAGPASVLEIAPPLDVIEPDVIVCSFAPEPTLIDPRPLVARLRQRHRVLHVGFEKHVRGDPRANVCFERLLKDRQLRSPFQFVQWARSFVRFHSSAVLVLTCAQDGIVFGDLAGTQHSIVCLSQDWPPPTGIEDLLAARARLRDPLPLLQSLLFAARMTPVNEYARMRPTSAADLCALFCYGLENASAVAFTAADQPAELERLGRARSASIPLYIARRKTNSDASNDGSVAVVVDRENFGYAVGVVALLGRALSDGGSLVVRTQRDWMDVKTSPGNVEVLARNATAPTPRPAAAIVLPGLVRDLRAPLELSSHGVPLLFYPTERAHPLVDNGDPRVVRTTTETDWRDLLTRVCAAESTTRAHTVERGRVQLAGWELAGRVAALLKKARSRIAHPA